MPSTHHPLSDFLVRLEAEDESFRLTITDYDRIRCVLGTGGKWSLLRLRFTLGSLLVRDKQQKATFNRVFDDFFETHLPETGLEIDVSKTLSDIEGLKQRAKRSLPFLRPRSAQIFQNEQSERRSRGARTDKWRCLVLALYVALLAIVLAFPDGFILSVYKPTPSVQQVASPPPIRDAPVSTSEKQPIEPKKAPEIAKQTVSLPRMGAWQRTPIKEDKAWQGYTFAAGFFLLLSIGYGLYLWLWRKPPDDQPPPFDPSKSRYFDVEKIGGPLTPRLDERTLQHLGDSTGYFQTEATGKLLDVEASIHATLESGLPELVFFKHKRLRRVIILKDRFAEALTWNPIADELAVGLDRLGVPVLAGTFGGSPNTFHAGRRTYYLEDLEDGRQGYMLLVFSDGKGFHAARDKYCLESLSRWPMIAWLDLRSPEFWDASAALPALYDIPVFPATPDGLVCVFNRFMTETANQADASDQVATGAGIPPQGDTSLSAYLETLLGQALPLAQDCTLIQPVSFGLIDAIRHKFYPHLPAQSVEKIIKVPGATRQVSGIRYSKEVEIALKRGFIARRKDDEQKDRIDFIVRKLDEAAPKDRESLEYLYLKAIRERVRVEWYEDAYENISQLSKTSLKNTISESLASIDMTGKQGAPLVKPPQGKYNQQRLASLAPRCGIQKTEAYPISKLKWSFLAVFILMAVVCSGMAIYTFINTVRPNQTIQFAYSGQDKIDVILEIDQNGTFETVQTGMLTDDLKWPLEPNRGYRLGMHMNAHFTKAIFQTQNEIITVPVEVDKTEELCQEFLDAAELVIYRCSPKSAAYVQTWRQRVADRAPQERLTSIGLELRSSRPQAGQISAPVQALLNTLSADWIYSYYGELNIFAAERFILGDSIKKMLNTIRDHVAPWELKNVQLIAWNFDREEFFDSEMYRGFGASVYLGQIKTLDDLLEPGNTVIINAAEIKAKLPNAEIAGKSIALLRPLAQDADSDGIADHLDQCAQTPPGVKVDANGCPLKYSLTIRTIPEGASVRFTNIDLPFQNKMMLEPGDYAFEVALKGYELHKGSVQIKDQNEDVEVRLVKEVPQITEFSLTVKTTPEDALVRIMNIKPQYHDGMLLKPGDYDIEASREGYETWREQITLEREAKVVEAVLKVKESTKGILIVSVQPPFATIKIARGDGTEETEVKNELLTELDPGEWDVRVSAEGYESEKKTIKIVAKKKTRVALKLIKPPQTQQTISSTANPKAGDQWTEPHTGITFVYVQGGTFTMGCSGKWAGNCDSDEKPAHEVTLDGFWMGKYEVTVKQFRQFIQEDKYQGKGYDGWKCNGILNTDGFKQADTHPAACISWNDASAFAKWLSNVNSEKYQFRLPTEAEWEYACRNGGQEVLYCGGDDIDAVAWYNSYSGSKTHEVGKKKHNGSGIYDMSGNVYEWCHDTYGKYDSKTKRNPTGPSSGSDRVLRGGSWFNFAWNCRSAYRIRGSPEYRDAFIGFRLVLPAGQPGRRLPAGR